MQNAVEFNNSDTIPGYPMCVSCHSPGVRYAEQPPPRRTNRNSALQETGRAGHDLCFLLVLPSTLRVGTVEVESVPHQSFDSLQDWHSRSQCRPKTTLGYIVSRTGRNWEAFGKSSGIS
jgi:hypothetical protein